MTDTKRQVIELPQADNVDNTDIFYLRSGYFDYQLPFGVLKDQIIGDAGFLQEENALSELTPVAQTARNNLGLGTAATHDVGVVAGKVMVIEETNGIPSLPVLDGSRLLNIPNTGGVSSNTAGNGLTIDQANSLHVNVDNQTLYIDDDKVKVQPSGLGEIHLSSGCVTASKISRAAIGDGLNVNATDGIFVQVDEQTLEINNGVLRIKPQSITETQIALNAKLLEFIEVPKFRVPNDVFIFPPTGKTMNQFRAVLFNVLGSANQSYVPGTALSAYQYEIMSDRVRIYATTAYWVELMGYIVWAI